jgi:hypothetical protein
MKQTAIEWLVEQWPILESQLPSWLIQQAKEMEKEQIIKHSIELAKILISNPVEVSGKTPQELINKYYNETFKSE